MNKKHNFNPEKTQIISKTWADQLIAEGPGKKPSAGIHKYNSKTPLKNRRNNQSTVEKPTFSTLMRSKNLKDSTFVYNTSNEIKVTKPRVTAVRMRNYSSTKTRPVKPTGTLAK